MIHNALKDFMCPICAPMLNKINIKSFYDYINKKQREKYFRIIIEKFNRSTCFKSV